MTSNARFRTHNSRHDEASDSDSQSDSGDGLIFRPCPTLASRFDTDELIQTCDDCGRFFARCCLHRKREATPCHHSRIVFTDGACANNGAHDSVSGIGIAFGRTGEDDQFSIPVGDRLDPGGRRTNQRAELLAAIRGLKKICKHDKENLLGKMEEHGVDLDSESPEIIITTDSEYVVKGMAEWLPRWRENNLRKSNGERPSNLDLFLDLGAAIEACQYKYGCKVQFWRIDRRYNVIADELAKRATRIAAGSGGRSGQSTNEFSGIAIAF
ncbi:ribonuclease H-like domain-containing protein [Boletus coccyginus]|nr:ribonuclease H-like domain-containing protein [Boletus coccyginus]